MEVGYNDIGISVVVLVGIGLYSFESLKRLELSSRRILKFLLLSSLSIFGLTVAPLSAPAGITGSAAFPWLGFLIGCAWLTGLIITKGNVGFVIGTLVLNAWWIMDWVKSGSDSWCHAIRGDYGLTFTSFRVVSHHLLMAGCMITAANLCFLMLSARECKRSPERDLKSEHF